MATKGMLRDRARGMRKQPSRAEQMLWDLLRGRQISGAKFRRQHPIDAYIADFACVAARLVVEIDGRSHDAVDQAVYDEGRTRKLNERGWRVLRVRDDDVLSNAPAVAELIAQSLRAAPSP